MKEKEFVSGLPDKKPPKELTHEEMLKKHEAGIARESIRRRLRVPHEMHTPEHVRKATDRMLGEREKEKG